MLPRGDDRVLSGPRGARASAKLGQSPCKPSTIQRLGVVLVDVRARPDNRAVLSSIPGPRERVAAGRRRSEDREDDWRGQMVRMARRGRDVTLGRLVG